MSALLLLSKPKKKYSTRKNQNRKNKRRIWSRLRREGIIPQINIINLPYSIYSLDELRKKIKIIKDENESGLM